MVEVRDYAAYVHGSQIKGAGGIPVGTGGKAMLLISGGIDSPVAGYMMANVVWKSVPSILYLLRIHRSVQNKK